MKEKFRAMTFRLSYAVLLTPWPVVFWFQTMPDWGGGAHGANALAGISKAVIPTLIGIDVVGWLFAIIGRYDWTDVARWFLVAIFHTWLLFTYIAANMVWYA